jgi:hypothetical protein
MIGLVHQDCSRVMVNRYRYRPSDGKLDSCTCTAASCKVVNDDFIKQAGLS